MGVFFCLSELSIVELCIVLVLIFSESMNNIKKDRFYGLFSPISTPIFMLKLIAYVL